MRGILTRYARDNYGKVWIQVLDPENYWIPVDPDNTRDPQTNEVLHGMWTSKLEALRGPLECWLESR